MRLARLFRRAPPAPAPLVPLAPGPVWAIGDVHGQRALMRALEARIAQVERARTGGPARVVYLGDYIDRGPDSAGVLDDLIAPPPEGIARHLLGGNHEEMFADFLDAPAPGAPWLDHGGGETLGSYGVWPDALPRGGRHLAAAVAAHVPGAHRAFLAGLAEAFVLPAPAWPGGRILFAHAGIDPALPPEAQPAAALRWIREPFLSADRPDGPVVVHGHTPVDQPERTASRINVDSGAGMEGPLTAVRLDPDGEVVFEQVTPA